MEWTYDTSFRPQTVSVNGANPVAYSYDQDSLVTGAGALAITRETDTGRESATTLGSVTTTRTYTPFGEPNTFVAQYNGSTIYAEDLDYDDRGWITEIERTQNGGTFNWSFGYDLRGRLETVEIDGMPESTYGYDVNSNRTSYDGQFGTVLPADVTVDARDRLLAYDDLTFTYTDAGELLTKTQSGQTVEYDYDVFGNLRTVELPGGTEIEYVTDGGNSRIGKKIDGTLVQGFLYQDALNPIAELDGAGAVVSRFVYGTRSNVPDYMVQGSVTYRIVADHLGSVRLVVDVATGTIAQEMRYDEFGRVTLDTSPGFQPFGFAGGIYDSQTVFVRFGARDYDPVTGRWLARDPIEFASGESNLYAYCLANPVSFVDTSGTEPEDPPDNPAQSGIMRVKDHKNYTFRQYPYDDFHGGEHVHDRRTGNLLGRVSTATGEVVDGGKVPNRATKLLRALGWLKPIAKKGGPIGAAIGFIYENEIEAGDQYTDEEEERMYQEYLDEQAEKAKEPRRGCYIP